MGKIPEQIQPLMEAWEELREARQDVAFLVGDRAGLAQAVQALTECERRLREIIAEYAPVADGGDEEDDDED
jgi:hypothetical protein